MNVSELLLPTITTLINPFNPKPSLQIFLFNRNLIIYVYYSQRKIIPIKLIYLMVYLKFDTSK